MKMVDFAESSKKDRKKLKHMGNLSKKYNKQNLGVIRDGTQIIRKGNVKKYQEMKNPSTSRTRRQINQTELLVDDVGIAITGNVNQFTPSNLKECPHCGHLTQIKEKVCPGCKKNLNN